VPAARPGQWRCLERATRSCPSYLPPVLTRVLVDRPRVVVVDDVVHVLAAPVDHPVVAVEGQLVAQPTAHPGPRTELFGVARDALQLGAAAFPTENGRLDQLFSLTVHQHYLACMASHLSTSCHACSLLALWIRIMCSMSSDEISSLFHFQPKLLNQTHIMQISFWSVKTFSQHCIPKHLLRWIDPIFISRTSFGYRWNFPSSWQWKRLIRSRILIWTSLLLMN